MNELNLPLVSAINGEARASTDVIARGVEQQHASVIRLVRKNLSSLEGFGRVRFEIRPFKTRGGLQQREVALLNEHQSALTISFMRNSPRVVEFKVNLIREFFRLRDELASKQKSLWQQMQELIAQEVESKVRASFGSHLMLERKREIPDFRQKRLSLESEIQPPLLLN